MFKDFKNSKLVLPYSRLLEPWGNSYLVKMYGVEIFRDFGRATNLPSRRDLNPIQSNWTCNLAWNVGGGNFHKMREFFETVNKQKIVCQVDSLIMQLSFTMFPFYVSNSYFQDWLSKAAQMIISSNYASWSSQLKAFYQSFKNMTLKRKKPTLKYKNP